MLELILNDRKIPIEFGYLWFRNDYHRTSSSHNLCDIEMQENLGERRNTCRMLGDDLVESERRRILNAKRDTLQRQQRIEQIEAEIENEIVVTAQNTMESDSLDENNGAEPTSAAEWNRRIREAIIKQNNESIEIPTFSRVYIPTWYDILWAVVWFVVFSFVLAIFCYRFQGIFITIFESVIEWTVYVYTVISQHIVHGIRNIRQLVGLTNE